VTDGAVPPVRFERFILPVLPFISSSLTDGSVGAQIWLAVRFGSGAVRQYDYTGRYRDR